MANSKFSWHWKSGGGTKQINSVLILEWKFYNVALLKKDEMEGPQKSIGLLNPTDFTEGIKIYYFPFFQSP